MDIWCDKPCTHPRLTVNYEGDTVCPDCLAVIHYRPRLQEITLRVSRVGTSGRDLIQPESE